MPACYVLADHCTAYIGETGNIGRRLSDHFRDQSKSFAREVYVISGYEGAWFDTTAALYLQYRLTKIAEQVHADAVVVGASEQLGHRIVGSLATRLVRAGKWPVIVVP